MMRFTIKSLVVAGILLPLSVYAGEVDVGSRFNIYGNLFGWHVFDIIYQFLLGTGLILIPFMILLYNAFMARDEGNRYDPVSALISMEIKTYVAVAMVYIFLVPTVSMNKLVFAYKEGATSYKSGNTKTTFDQYDKFLPEEVQIPFGWYAVLYASSGFSDVMKKILPTGDQARGIMYQLQKANMDDPKLQTELNQLEKRCRLPAAARLNILMGNHSSSKLAKKIDDYTKSVNKDIGDHWWDNNVFRGSDAWKIAPVYPGNEIYKKWLYGAVPYCVSIPPPAGEDKKYVEEHNLCIPGTEAPVNPVKGKTCTQMWEDLKVGLNKYYSKKLPELLVNNDSFLYGRMTSGNMKSTSKGAGDIKTGWSGVFQKLFEWGAGWKLNIGNLFKSFFNSVLRFLLPITLGVITMLFIMLLPILILFGRYQLGSIVSIGITFFGLSFLPGIWHIAAWLDQVMILAVYGSKGVIDATVSLERGVLDVVSFGAYVLFTHLWIGFLREMGGFATLALSNVMGIHSEAHGSWGKARQNAGRIREAGKRILGGGNGGGKRGGKN